MRSGGWVGTSNNAIKRPVNANQPHRLIKTKRTGKDLLAGAETSRVRARGLARYSRCY